MPDTSKPWYTTVCPKCGSAWCGLKTCHCTVCHATFSTITGFDRHRTGPVGDRSCITPEQAGLVLMPRDYSCWGLPGEKLSPNEKRKLRARQSTAASARTSLRQPR